MATPEEIREINELFGTDYDPNDPDPGQSWDGSDPYAGVDDMYREACDHDAKGAGGIGRMTGAIEHLWVRSDGGVYRVPDPALPHGGALLTLYDDGRIRCHTEGQDACRHTMRLRLWAIIMEEASYPAGSDLGERLQRLLGRVGQAVPEREPWQDDAEYERMCRHLREAHGAAHGERV